MKHIKRLTFFFTLTLLVTAASAQVSSADSMIHRLFTTLKNKDEKSFVSLYPNTQQMNKLVRGMMETMFKSEEMQKMMAMDEKSKNLNLDSLIDVQMAQMNKPETQAEMQKSYSETFQKIIEKGEKKGVNWNQAQLVSYTIDSSANLTENEEMRMLASSGIKAMKGVIDFKAGGTDYQMNYDKVLYIPSERGWFGGEFKQVIKKGESFAQETDEHITADTTAVTTTDAPKSKAKTKTDGNKTKVKTKTPATKTKTKTKSKA